ncbi:hypothetical protein VPH35_089034 [Triticum aestivum]
MASHTPHQVVRLTRCINVPDHTTMLVCVMTKTGYRWYPEYTVEVHYRDFNQSQYLCTVRIYPTYPGATDPIHWSYGLGVTVDMLVQDTAYSMMTIIRDRHVLLQNTEFCYMPATLPGEEGYYTGFYIDATHEEPRLQTTTELWEDRDCEVRALWMELYNTRVDHWGTLTRLAPVVHTGYLDMEALYPVRSHLPDRMDCPDVGGITPPRGRCLPPAMGPRPHPFPYAPRDREFLDPHVPLRGHGGNLYEVYYRDV